MCLQVASCACHHIRVAKALDPQGRSITCFEVLEEGAPRLAELSAMMGLGEAAASQLLQQTQPGAQQPVAASVATAQLG